MWPLHLYIPGAGAGLVSFRLHLLPAPEEKGVDSCIYVGSLAPVLQFLQVCRSSVLSRRYARLPCRMLPPGESLWVYRSTGQTDGQTDRRTPDNYITLSARRSWRNYKP